MKVPERIKQSFETQQHQSEFWVAGVQLATIITLLVIYYLAPSGFSDDAPVRSAGLGLYLFVILILCRLWFTYTKQLSYPVLAISVVVEMLLLLFVIWVYHLQFEESPNINLKNTQIAYVFVLIGLRALRFDPFLILLSGLTAILGWCWIVWDVVNRMGKNVITWDYVTYASSRSLYPGAELDKILAIFLVTAIALVVVTRARKTLFDATSQSIAAQDLAKFFDADVADKITGAEITAAPGQAELKNAAIVFTDLRGFTHLAADLSPVELIQYLGEYQALVVPIIQKHGGSIDKFMGDGILASFGATSTSTLYAADALRAADDVMAQLNEWNLRLSQRGLPAASIGVGVAVGEVLFGVIGFGARLEYTVLGDPVNLAAKLEKQNKIEQSRVLAPLSVLTLAIEQGYQAKENVNVHRQVSVGGVTGELDLVVLH